MLAILLYKIFSEINSLFKRSALFLLVVFIVFHNISCGDEPSSLGSNLLNQDVINILSLDSEKDSLFQSYGVYRQVLSLSNADRLLLGRKDNAQASILIRFLIYLNDSITTQFKNNQLVVTDAFIQFTKNYSFGDSLAPLDYTVHNILSSWSTGFTSDSLSLLSFDAIDISSNKVFSDSINSFKLDNSVAYSWLKAHADSNFSVNNGLYIKPSLSSNKIIGFQALSTLDVPLPYLFTVIEKPGVYVDTLKFFPSVDLSVITGTIADVGSENFAVQSGINSLATIFFDLSNLPRTSVINNAVLILTLDTLQTVTGSSFSNSLRVNYLTDSANLAIDSTSLIFMDRVNHTFRATVTSYIQQSLIKKNYQGFLISAADKMNGMELFAVRGSNASIYAERPKLEIIYTMPK
mgnify:CR=1 FL=1